MGKIKKLHQGALVGEGSSEEVYPVTAAQAVYHSNGSDLETLIDNATSDANWAAAANSYYRNSQAGNVAAKVITTYKNINLRGGGSLKVTFEQANTANDATLNIDGTGAKPLYYNGARVSSTNSWGAGETVEIYYNNYNSGAYHAKRWMVEPVSVSQNSQTGHIDITVGDVTTPVTSVEELNRLNLRVTNNLFTGAGNTAVNSRINGLIPSNTYRIWLPQNNWDMSGVTITGVYRFFIYSFDSNGTQTTLVFKMIDASIAPFYDVILPQNHSYLVVGGRAASGVSVSYSIEDITLIKQKADLVAYFAGPTIPEIFDINLSTPTLKIKFPAGGLRLYTSFGESLIGEYIGAANQTFTLNNLQSLVWDFSDSSVKVVGTEVAGDYVHLLNLAKNSVTGLFAGWFNEQIWLNNNPQEIAEKATNTLGESLSASKSYPIVSGGSSFSGLVDIGIPYHRQFIFRIIDNDVTLVSSDSNPNAYIAGYDYEGNSVNILLAEPLKPNTDYVCIAPCGLKSVRAWISSTIFTGVSGTISVQVTVLSQYDDESIVRRWNENDKITIKDNVLINSDFKALFFSDIHGASKKLERIIQLGKDWLSNLDCILDTGDDTASYQSSTPLAWYNTLAQISELPIVRAVGNHDAWSTDYGVWATPQEIYNFFTKPAVELLQSKGATVVQPSDAATAYRNYYYVDFGSVRMVVILSLTGGGYYDADQNTWFESVLADAITNNKSVICANHAPMPLDDSVKNIECNWCSYMPRTSDGTIMEEEPLIAVDTFIRNGGKFICWLTGHTHIDYVMKYNRTINDVTITQFAFTTSCAKGGVNDGVQPSDIRNVGYDLFNMVSVDLTNHLLKIWRIGFNTNAYLQVHNTFVWDFVNNMIVSES